MKQSVSRRPGNKSVLVYIFFIVAVVVFFYDQAREGKLVVTSRPAGATVYVDRKDLGKTPLHTIAKRGEHQIEVLLEGYLPVSQTVLIEAGKTVALDLEMVPSRK